MTFNGQQVTTESFLAMFGLKRPLAHEPWHIQPLEGAPTPDNPDPNAKSLVADANGNAVDLETGKSKSISPPASAVAQPQEVAAFPSVSDSGPMATPPPATAAAESQVAALSSVSDPLAIPPPATAAAESQVAALSSVSDPLAIPPPATASAGPVMTSVQSMPYTDTPPSSITAQSSNNNANLNPVTNITGPQVAQGSAQLEASKMIASATPPPPVMINNQSAGSQKPIESPKTPLPKASSRSSEELS